jgi:DNA-binding GntR family transcriptional regulator
MGIPTTIQHAYEHIRERIVAGEFPPGSVISEAALAKDLGVSRTPVGEALRELANAGFVEQVPRYGTIVRAISRQEIVELYELREALEPYAVALAAERISPADVHRLEALRAEIEGALTKLRRSRKPSLEGPELREFLAADMAFHTLLIAAAGNRRINALVRDSHLMTELFGAQGRFHDERVVAEACDFHARILDAVREGNAKAARIAAAEHVRASLRYNLESFDRISHQPQAAVDDVRLPESVRALLNRPTPEPPISKPKRRK